MKAIRSFIQNTFQQIKNLTPFLIPSYLIVFVLFLTITIIGEYFNVPLSIFTRDPTQILNGHPLTGVISNIGILLWCSTSAICLFSYVVHYFSKRNTPSRFLLHSGLISLFLLLDDLFMFHETLFPKYFHLSEIVVYLIYLTIIVAYLLKFRKNILHAEHSLFQFALVFFAMSIFIDVFVAETELVFLIEDGFKLLGIVSWFLFFTRTCFILTQKLLSS